MIKHLKHCSVIAALLASLICSGVNVNAEYNSSSLNTDNTSPDYCVVYAENLADKSSREEVNSLQFQDEHSKLKMLIEKNKEQNDTYQIIWNKKFVENEVRYKYFDLYQEIQKQLDDDKYNKVALSNKGDKLITLRNNSVSRSAEPEGESTYKFGVTAYKDGKEWYKVYSVATWRWTYTKLLVCSIKSNASPCGSPGLICGGITVSSENQLAQYGPVTIVKGAHFFYLKQGIPINLEIRGTYEKPVFEVDGKVVTEFQLPIDTDRSYEPCYSFQLRCNGGYSIISQDIN